MIGSTKEWTYVSVGMVAVLVAGFSVPQAFAHITTSAEHMLEHIYKFTRITRNNVIDIKEKTDSLPSDPASQSKVEDAMFTKVQFEHIRSDGLDSGVECTSDSDFMIIVAAGTSNEGAGQVNVRVEGDGFIEVGNYRFTNSQSLTFGGEAGTKIGISVQQILGPPVVFAMLAVQTGEGAELSCINPILGSG